MMRRNATALIIMSLALARLSQGGCELQFEETKALISTVPCVCEGFPMLSLCLFHTVSSSNNQITKSSSLFRLVAFHFSSHVHRKVWVRSYFLSQACCKETLHVVTIDSKTAIFPSLNLAGKRQRGLTYRLTEGTKAQQPAWYHQVQHCDGGANSQVIGNKDRLGSILKYLSDGVLSKRFNTVDSKNPFIHYQLDLRLSNKWSCADQPGASVR